MMANGTGIALELVVELIHGWPSTVSYSENIILVDIRVWTGGRELHGM